MEKRTNKIYAIRRYRTLEEELKNGGYGDVVYVGKTKRELYERIEQHRNDLTHPEKVEWLQKNKHEIILLEEVEDWNVPYQEQYWIDYFSTKFKLNRIRANKITYNDGVSAMKRAKAHIKKMKKDN